MAKKNRFQSQFIAFIAVRKDSKSLPGKNVRELNGIPLYEIAVQKAIKANCNNVIISTNIPEIHNRKFRENIHVFKRQEFLSRDDTPISDVIYNWSVSNHSASYHNNTVVALLQATSPLSTFTDLKKAYDKFCLSDATLLMSVTEADNKILKYGLLSNEQFVPISESSYCFSNRQSLPKVVRPNGAIYLFELGNFRRNKTFDTQKIIPYEMSVHHSIDIDTVEDLEFVREQLNSDRGVA